MSVQRVITDECAEQTTVRWDGERLAIIWIQHRPHMPSTHVARLLYAREAHEVADFIRKNVPRCTPGCPSAPMQADVQDGDSFVKGISTGVAGDLDRQPAE